MTDQDKNDIDLTKEIEELDEFLDEQEVDFPLDGEDDDDGDFGTPEFASGTPIEKEKKVRQKASFAKFFGYLLLLCVLIGGAYAAYLFAPQFIQKPEFEKVSNFVSNESGETVKTLKDIFKSYVPTSDKTVKNELDSPKEPIDTMASLPTPSDEGLDVLDDSLFSIAEEMDFSSNATNDTVAEPTLDENQANAIMEDLQQDVQSTTGNDLPALKDETIEAANGVMDMPREDLFDIVEAYDNVTPEEVIDIADDEVSEPTIEMNTVVVETKKSIPVKAAPAPVKITEPKSYKPEDPRVEEARSLLDKGDYNGALNLYNDILQSDPANTSALTGRQLAQAKLRMGGQQPVAIKPQPTSRMPSAPVAPVTQSASVASNSGELATLLQQAQVNPNDAMLAFKIGNAYKGADNVKAMEWYRKALQIDVFNSSGLDRMAVYDAMADIQ